MSKEQQEQSKEKVKLTVTQIKADLASGLDRVAIKEKYGLTASSLKQLFQHSKLKGLKVKAAPNFELEDDEADDAPEEKTPKEKPSKADKQKELAKAKEVATEEVVDDEEEKTEEIEKKKGTTKDKGVW